MVLRVILLGYVFYKLNFYAFGLPIAYSIIFYIFLFYKHGISVMIQEILGVLISFVSPCISSSDFKELNLRSPSKLIFNGLSFIILTIAITFSLLPTQNDYSCTAEDCQSLCMYKNETENYNSTMLTACKNLSLPDDVNLVYIGIVCFFWLLSNLELFLEAHFDFMPWNKFHVRWQIEEDENEQENEHKNDNEPENFKNETSMNKQPEAEAMLSPHDLNLV